MYVKKAKLNVTYSDKIPISKKSFAILGSGCKFVLRSLPEEVLEEVC